MAARKPDDELIHKLFGATSAAGLSLHVDCAQLMHARYYPSAGDHHTLERAIAHAKILKGHLDRFLAAADPDYVPMDNFIPLGEAVNLVVENLAVKRTGEAA